MREKREAEQEQREAQHEARSAVTQKKLADEVAAFAAAIAPVPDFKVNFHYSLRKKSCKIQRQPQQPFDQKGSALKENCANAEYKTHLPLHPLGDRIRSANKFTNQTPNPSRGRPLVIHMFATLFLVPHVCPKHRTSK